MKYSIHIVTVWLALAGWCAAQVDVSVVLDPDQFLRNGPMPVKVRLVNSSGQTLHLGRETNWLFFCIQDSQGRDARQVDKIPLADPFDLESSRVANLSIDLMPYFEISKMGKYTIQAVLKVSQLGREFASPVKNFDIVTGTKLWEREFGVPTSGTPEVRKYALQQANFLKELRLYLRITDPGEGTIFRVVSLGTLVSFSKPEAQLDKSSNLHVLYQNNARSFLYQVLTPDGDLIIRQTHEYYKGSRPTLRFNNDSGVMVAGGRRRIYLSDLPPPTDESLAAPPPPEPVPTNTPPKNAKSTKKDKTK